MEYNYIISTIKSSWNPDSIAGMGRYGINTSNACGVSIPTIRKMAKQIGTNHNLALKLWESNIHEARLLAVFISDHSKINSDQIEKWVNDLDSWDICDQFCNNLVRKTLFRYDKVYQWCQSDREFVKRAGFSLIAVLAVHDKNEHDDVFERLLFLIKEKSEDERNFVKKAVNWALRQIGKRNIKLNSLAIKMAQEIALSESKSARWIAKGAIRELTDEKIIKRLKA